MPKLIDLDISEFIRKPDKPVTKVIDGTINTFIPGQQNSVDNTEPEQYNLFAQTYKEPDFRQDPASHRDESLKDASTLALMERATEETTQSDIKLPFGPLRSLDIRRIKSTVDLIEQLTNDISLNEYNLPIYIYRPDMLDFQYITHGIAAYLGWKDPSSGPPGTTTTSFSPAKHAVDEIEGIQSSIDAALVVLDYTEGFPTLPSGNMFWEKLDFEPQESYAMFLAYLEMGGVRKISGLISYPLEEVKLNFHLYYWGYRVKAYELYRAVHHQKVRIQRALMAEDDHYIIAGKMLQKVSVFLESLVLSEENLTPDKAVHILEKLVKIQRISAGLPANGESKENHAPRTPGSTSTIITQITAQQGTTQQQQDIDYDLLKEDPDAIDLAQKLIVSMQSRGN